VAGSTTLPLILLLLASAPLPSFDGLAQGFARIPGQGPPAGLARGWGEDVDLCEIGGGEFFWLERLGSGRVGNRVRGGGRGSLASFYLVTRGQQP